MSTKIGVFYEPGAGGDFFITLLSLGLNIFEEPEILYYDDGRIKVRGKSMLDVVDDYEYTDDDCSLEELFLKQNFDRYISKCHPYLPEQKDEFVRKLETRYKDTYNIMLHRDNLSSTITTHIVVQWIHFSADIISHARHHESHSG